MSSSGGNGTGMSAMLLKQRRPEMESQLDMSLSDVYKSTGANGGIGGGSIGRERNGSRWLVRQLWTVWHTVAL